MRNATSVLLLVGLCMALQLTMTVHGSVDFASGQRPTGQESAGFNASQSWLSLLLVGLCMAAAHYDCT